MSARIEQLREVLRRSLQCSGYEDLSTAMEAYLLVADMTDDECLAIARELGRPDAVAYGLRAIGQCVQLTQHYLQMSQLPLTVSALKLLADQLKHESSQESEFYRLCTGASWLLARGTKRRLKRPKE
jgi:hypothetical protein